MRATSRTDSPAYNDYSIQWGGQGSFIVHCDLCDGVVEANTGRICDDCKPPLCSVCEDNSASSLGMCDFCLCEAVGGPVTYSLPLIIDPAALRQLAEWSLLI